MGFLLIDAKNAFNEQNRTAHVVDSSTRMSKRSKVYLQLLQALVYTRDPKQRWHWQFLYSKGCVAGDPLSMFAYGIGLLPLIRALKVQFQRSDLVRG
jgi:hypothetical protein